MDKGQATSPADEATIIIIGQKYVGVSWNATVSSEPKEDVPL